MIKGWLEMENKQVKQMMVDVFINENEGFIDWCKFYTFGLYAWYLPPLEGGKFVEKRIVSLTANQLKGK